VTSSRSRGTSCKAAPKQAHLPSLISRPSSSVFVSRARLRARARSESDRTRARMRTRTGDAHGRRRTADAERSPNAAVSPLRVAVSLLPTAAATSPLAAPPSVRAAPPNSPTASSLHLATRRPAPAVAPSTLAVPPFWPAVAPFTLAVALIWRTRAHSWRTLARRCPAALSPQRNSASLTGALALSWLSRAPSAHAHAPGEKPDVHRPVRPFP